MNNSIKVSPSNLIVETPTKSAAFVAVEVEVAINDFPTYLLPLNNKHGAYHPFGGKVETNEEPACAAARELEEECGVVILPSELVLIGERFITYDDIIWHEHYYAIDHVISQEEVQLKEPFLAKTGKFSLIGFENNIFHCCKLTGAGEYLLKKILNYDDLAFALQVA